MNVKDRVKFKHLPYVRGFWVEVRGEPLKAYEVEVNRPVCDGFVVDSGGLCRRGIRAGI